MAKHESDSLSQLRDLTEKTANIKPTDGLTDAVMATLHTTNQTLPLEHLAKATHSLAPSEAFTDAIMQAATGGTQENAWLDGIARLARFALVGAAAAAAISLILSSQAEHTYDRAVLESVAAVEVDE